MTSSYSVATSAERLTLSKPQLPLIDLRKGSQLVGIILCEARAGAAR
jgi:hypothetical protein